MKNETSNALIGSLSVGALVLGLTLFLPRRNAQPLLPRLSQGKPPPAAETARHLSLYAVPPVWLGAALADWFCHRATHIEKTSGTKESVIHLLMQIEMALPVLAVLFFEVTPPVLGLGIAAFLLHEATAFWDLHYAAPRRTIAPVEQMIHSFLELVPLIGLTLVAVLHGEEARRLARPGQRPAWFDLHPRKTPLPRFYRPALLSVTTLLAGGFYLEELWRCIRASRANSRSI